MNNPENPPPAPPIAAPPGPAEPSEGQPTAEPPPAAKSVLEGTKTEREAALERTVKEREQRISELEDENRQLKTPPPEPPKPKHWFDDLI